MLCYKPQPTNPTHSTSKVPILTSKISLKSAQVSSAQVDKELSKNSCHDHLSSDTVQSYSKD